MANAVGLRGTGPAAKRALKESGKIIKAGFDKLDDALVALKRGLLGKTDDATRKAEFGAAKNTGAHSKKLGDALENAGYPRPTGDYQAGHLIPTNSFRSRSSAVQDAIQSAQSKFDEFLGPDLRDEAINGFWANAGHAGTHSDEFFLALGKAFEDVDSAASATKALDGIWKRVEAGEFIP